MGRRDSRRLRKRPIGLTAAARATVLDNFEEHAERVCAGYKVTSLRLWLNERGDFTYRIVYRKDGVPLSTIAYTVRGVGLV